MNDAITYKEVEGRRGSWSIKVYHDDTYVGDIKLVEGGFAYFARGSKARGDVFKSVAEVQRSLEGDD